MQAEPLQVQFMSGFEVSYGGKVLNLGQGGGAKASQLLAQLLFFADTGVAREKLLASLYQNEEADPANSLKALTFRLRKRLAENGLPAGEYILIKDGVYRFTDDIPVLSDVKTMEDALGRASTAESADVRAAAWKAVCDAYAGELLPAMADEMWVICENARLSDLVTSAARYLCAYYRDRREYENTYALCKRLSVFFPFDEEWHIEAINSLISTGKYQQALDEYEAVTSMLFDEMGVYPSERLLDCARAISSKVTFPLSAATDVDNALKDSGSAGAYYCSYPSFADSYRVLKRIMDRDGIPSCLLLCTAMDGKRPVEKKELLVPAMQRLGVALGRTLRKSDMYTRYSGAQMLVMLWGTPPDNAELVINRIEEAYAAQCKAKDGVSMDYTVLSGDEPPRPIVTAKLKPNKSKWKKMTD